MFRRASVLAVFLGIALGWAICGSARADIVISIQDEEVIPGGTAFVEFYAQSNVGYRISGFNLPTDINRDNVNMLPTGFTLNATPILNAMFNNTFFAKSPSIDVALVDGIIIGNGVNETLGISPRKLFDLVIDVASSVPVGTKIPIELRIPAGDLESLFAVSGPDNPPVFAPTTGASVVGYISVVPEPSSFVMLALISLVAASNVAVRRLGHG